MLNTLPIVSGRLKDAANIIRRDADRIAEILTLEQGKIFPQN